MDKKLREFKKTEGNESSIEALWNHIVICKLLLIDDGIDGVWPGIIVYTKDT